MEEAALFGVMTMTPTVFRTRDPATIPSVSLTLNITHDFTRTFKHGPKEAFVSTAGGHLS